MTLTGVPFKAWPHVLAEVSAKQCLWLTYAPPGVTLTYGETTNPGDGYLPASFRVPSSADQVTIEVLAGYWRHDPAQMYASDADGTAFTTITIFLPSYQNATLGSTAIQDVATALKYNRLVGLWQYANTAKSTRIFDARPNTAVHSFPDADRPSHLRLGAHDSHHWTNNSGMVQVLIKWAKSAA